MYFFNSISSKPADNPFIENAWEGIKWGVVVFPLKVITFEIVNKIVNRILLQTNLNTKNVSQIYPLDLLYPVIIGPFLEEAITKLLIRNGIFKIQNLTKKYTFSWINSSQARIILTGFLFATPHLMGNSIDIASSISRFAFLILFPTEAILFEKSGFVSAFFAHATHNALGLLFFRYIK